MAIQVGRTLRRESWCQDFLDSAGDLSALFVESVDFLSGFFEEGSGAPDLSFSAEEPFLA